MRQLLFILLILLVIAIFVWARLQVISLRLDIDIKPKKLGLKEFFKTIGRGETTLKPELSVAVNNRNDFSIPISNLKIKIFKDGKLVGKSQDIPENKYRVKIPANGEVVFDHFGELYVVEEFFNILKEGVFDYEARLKIYSIPVKFSDTFRLDSK